MSRMGCVNFYVCAWRIDWKVGTTTTLTAGWLADRNWFEYDTRTHEKTSFAGIKNWEG
jgi:hypothetical protein